MKNNNKFTADIEQNENYQTFRNEREPNEHLYETIEEMSKRVFDAFILEPRYYKEFK